MAIDLREVRDEVIGHLTERTNAAYDTLASVSPYDYVLYVGFALFGVGIGLGCIEHYKAWRKKRGYRMVLQERRDKIDRLLADGINDLLFEAELAGKISSKELDAEYQRLAHALKLPDLIPAKRRARIVKNEIKSRLNKAPKGTKPQAPITGKPQPLRVRIGTFANQFWRAKGA